MGELSQNPLSDTDDLPHSIAKCAIEWGTRLRRDPLSVLWCGFGTV